MKITPLRALFVQLHRAWSRSIQRQLAWSFSLVVLSVIFISGYSLYSYQRHFLYTQGNNSALELAQALAYSSSSWLLSNDVVGLQEVLVGVAHATDLQFAVVLDTYGEVMASTRPEYINQFFADPQSKRLLTLPVTSHILLNKPNLIDVAVPIKAGTRHIGWVRLELSRDTTNTNLRKLVVAGIGMAILTMLIIVLIATSLAKRMSRGLARLSAIANDAERGLAFRQEETERTDEIGELARHLYRMLNAIAAEQRAKRESEALFRVVFNDALVGLAQVSTTGQFLQVNTEFCRIIGYSKQEVLSQTFTFQQITFPDDLAADMAHVNALLQGLGNSFTLEKRYIRKEGNIIWVNLSVYLQRDLSGNPLYFIGSILDITERKSATETLRKHQDHLEEVVQQRTEALVLSRQAAEAANQAKSVFLANMSHELRTPLNAILGFSSLLRKDTLMQPQREKLDIINRSGEHLLTLINDVLEMAKIEAGRVQLEKVTFDFGGMVRDVTDMMNVRAHDKGISLQIDQSSCFPRYIKSDEARLRQVLINLIGNAIKFTQQGGVLLRMKTKENHTSRLIIEVEDTGMGIKADDLDRIFEPFVQLGEDASQKGTGLGLSITRQFVQLMEGTLSVTSTFGKGSIFKVELPVEEIAAGDIIHPETPPHTEIVGLAAGQPEYRILIVEDQIENQMLLTHLMKDMGFLVKIAENGEQGVQLFSEWHPHFIWMDRRMPVMDGLEATRRIRALPDGDKVKIVAVTASAMLEQREEILTSGMDDFVRKPYRANEIYECLSRHLGVQYIYASGEIPQHVHDTPFTAERMAILPLDLRQELAEVLDTLDDERIMATIGKVAAYDTELYKILSQMAENFNYPAIQSALQSKRDIT